MRTKTVIYLLLAATVLLLIKVYVANKIYTTSREIQKNVLQINALKEERNILKIKIEKLRYQNTIIDPLFSYMPPKIETSDDNVTLKKNETEIKPKIKKKNTKQLFEILDAN